ncbi:hypothetical protein [Celerinatantimonas diazotrophica]|uniref:AbiTii domain-containing protein n=1 Tax=Celerinatantimonas diazotrophica TaxID=412034 RepID=A0A4R1KFA7_9GAMM|nr:hypothetical protein [Celerinatantimonas diazotrophica]TCK63322.1 hypothetical protein EV690_0208 [Celerinatantimonas diazotrophica]CAG9298466.1 hypothetical protein CEDIAZO_03671 [Celerinatantimonas diazotrophica]
MTMSQTNARNQIDAYIRELLAYSEEQLDKLPHNQALKIWLEKEIQGYEAGDLLPECRHIACQHQGLFANQLGQPGRLEFIRPSALAARDRCHVQYMALRSPLCQYLEVTQVVRQPWPEQFIERYKHDLIPGLVCLQAWQIIDTPPVSRMLAGMLEHLRQLLLDAGDEHFDAFNAFLCELGGHYPLLKPLWESRPTHKLGSQVYC